MIPTPNDTEITELTNNYQSIPVSVSFSDFRCSMHNLGAILHASLLSATKAPRHKVLIKFRLKQKSLDRYRAIRFTNRTVLMFYILSGLVSSWHNFMSFPTTPP